MNKYKFKKILENHPLFYGVECRLHNERCYNRDYIRGWLDAVDSIANKTGIKLHSGVLNDFICKFFIIYNLSEILFEGLQSDVIIPNKVTDPNVYIKGHDDIYEYMILNIMMGE